MWQHLSSLWELDALFLLFHAAGSSVLRRIHGGWIPDGFLGSDWESALSAEPSVSRTVPSSTGELIMAMRISQRSYLLLLIPLMTSGCGGPGSSRTGQQGASTTTSSTTATPCPVPVADLNALRAQNNASSGTLSPTDQRLTRFYFSKDARNFSAQVSAGQLETANIGLPGSLPDPNQRFWVVVSHGDFDIPTSANIYSAPTIVTPASSPVSSGRPHATVAYVIVDAVTGAYKGEEFKFAGCTTEG